MQAVSYVCRRSPTFISFAKTTDKKFQEVLGSEATAGWFSGLVRCLNAQASNAMLISLQIILLVCSKFDLCI